MKARVLLLLIGLIEGVWGAMQLCGVVESGHPRYPVTGSFYNPGPFGCFIGCLLPLAAQTYLEKRGNTINADNGITPGHRYELYYWTDTRGWSLHSSQVAKADSLTAIHVPKGALLWLKDLSKGQEEMPFFITKRSQQFIYQLTNS